jgi:hypothetical protein
MSDIRSSRPVSSKIPPEVGELFGERVDALLDVGSDHGLSLLAVDLIAGGGGMIPRGGGGSGFQPVLEGEAGQSVKVTIRGEQDEPELASQGREHHVDLGPNATVLPKVA